MSKPTIRDLLDIVKAGAPDPIDAELAARVEKVVALHSKWSCYDACSHEHTQAEVEVGNALEVNEVGLTCEDGWLYDVCRECHTADGDPIETTEDGEWPCATVRLLNGEDV